MKKKFYNVWHTSEHRWANNSLSRLNFNSTQLRSLTYDAARDLCGVLNSYRSSRPFEVRELKSYKPKKIIPDIPMDTTLPILMAGHLQDRQRKRS